ncbi:hypothetical protein D3C73_1060820 [compost metagenome]
MNLANRLLRIPIQLQPLRLAVLHRLRHPLLRSAVRAVVAVHRFVRRERRGWRTQPEAERPPRLALHLPEDDKLIRGVVLQILGDLRLLILEEDQHPAVRLQRMMKADRRVRLDDYKGVLRLLRLPLQIKSHPLPLPGFGMCGCPCLQSMRHVVFPAAGVPQLGRHFRCLLRVQQQLKAADSRVRREQHGHVLPQPAGFARLCQLKCGLHAGGADPRPACKIRFIGAAQADD